MVTRDLAIKYKSLYQETEIIIDNIKELGFDMDEYEKELLTISEKVNNNIKTTIIKNFARASYENYYSEGINNLNILKNRLDKYNIYYKVLNSCNYINIKIKNKNINKEELDKYVSEMIYNLKLIIKSDTMDYAHEKHIVEAIYKTAYDVIKLEIIKTNGSQLYLFCKNEEVNISYFNKLIKEEIKKYDLNDDKYNFLRMKMYEIKRKGIETNYFDIDLIKYILVFSDNFNIKESLKSNLDNINNEVKTSYSFLTDSDNQYRGYYKTLDRVKNNISEDKGEIKKKIISLLITISLLTGGSFGVGAICKKRNTDCDKYTKTTETYLTIDDKVTSHSEELFLGNKKDNSVTIKVYDEYLNNKKRKYRLYDVSDYDFSDIEDYYKYGIDNYEIVPEKKTARLSNGDTIINYKDGYIEVERITYKYDGKYFNQEAYEDDLVGFYFLYILFFLVIDLFYLVINDKTFLIGNIKELKKDIDSLKYDEKDYLSNKKEIEEKINVILNEINKYEGLKASFDKLFEENKYLLDNPNKLIKKYDTSGWDEQVENIKKRVKEYKSK